MLVFTKLKKKNCNHLFNIFLKFSFFELPRKKKNKRSSYTLINYFDDSLTKEILNYSNEENLSFVIDDNFIVISIVTELKFNETDLFNFFGDCIGPVLIFDFKGKKKEYFFIFKIGKPFKNYYNKKFSKDFINKGIRSNLNECYRNTVLGYININRHKFSFTFNNDKPLYYYNINSPIKKISLNFFKKLFKEKKNVCKGINRNGNKCKRLVKSPEIFCCFHKNL